MLLLRNKSCQKDYFFLIRFRNVEAFRNSIVNNLVWLYHIPNYRKIPTGMSSRFPAKSQTMFTIYSHQEESIWNANASSHCCEKMTSWSDETMIIVTAKARGLRVIIQMGLLTSRWSRGHEYSDVSDANYETRGLMCLVTRLVMIMVCTRGHSPHLATC